MQMFGQCNRRHVLAGLASLVPSVLAAQTPVRLRSGSMYVSLGAQPGRRPPVVTAVAIDQAGRYLASAGDDHVVRLWRYADRKLHRELRGHADWVRTAAFEPVGKLLATAGDDRQVRLWNVQSGALESTLPLHPGVIYTLQFSPDGQWLATAGFEDWVRVYEVRTGELKHRLACPCHDVRALEITADGRLIAAGSRANIRVWDLRDGGKPLRDLAPHYQRLRCLAVSPDGEHWAAAGEGPMVYLWRTGTDEKVGELRIRPGKALSLAWCGPNRLAVGTTVNDIRLWDIQSKEDSHRLQGHEGSVCCLAYDARHNRLLSGSFDTTIRLWELDDEQHRVVRTPRPLD